MRLILLFLSLLGTALQAEPPKVVTTIAPLYGILSDLMRGVGAPTPIVVKGSDPHFFSLRPSQIFALNDADILFAVGGNIEPWLSRVLPDLTADVVFLADIALVRDFRLPLRDLNDIKNQTTVPVSAPFDPHMWLDPTFGRIWVFYAATVLARNDPDNAATYIANARKMIDALNAAALLLQQTADAVADTNIVTSHDSLQYLENRFNLNIVGALSSASGDQAGARSLGALRRFEGSVCLLTDISESANSLANLFPDWPQVILDPLGHDLAGEPDYLANLYLAIAAALENCIIDP